MNRIEPLDRVIDLRAQWPRAQGTLSISGKRLASIVTADAPWRMPPAKGQIAGADQVN